MAFIEHLLWVVIMCGAIRNTDYRTAVYSPKRQCPSQRFFSLVSSHSSAWLHRSLSRGCGLCYIVSHCRRHSPSMLPTTLRALTDTFTSMHTAHRSGIVFLIWTLRMIAALKFLELDHQSKWKQICLDPSMTDLNLFSFFNSPSPVFTRPHGNMAREKFPQ